jgi:GPI mannosyltransferase 3
MYKKFYVGGLIAFILAAWFTVGFHYPDEHFQVLEFCNYKLGLSAAADLPWEFKAQSRSTLLPCIVYAIAKPMLALGIYNPFLMAFVLRLMMALASWLVIQQSTRKLLPTLQTEQGKIFFVCASFLFWFVPYLSVRFTGENISGLLLTLAALMLLNISDLPESAKTRNSLLSGLFLGLAVFCRVQIVLAYIGLGIWLLFIAKFRLKEIALIAAGFLVAIALGMAADKWFYGDWIFTPYTYFKKQVLEDVASKFGVTPWWGYFWLFTQSAVPPISIALMYLFFRGVWKRPLHLFSLIGVSFIFLHFLIGHKETRFLFPTLIASFYIYALGYEAVITNVKNRKAATYITRFLWGMNWALLGIRTLMPANEIVKYYEFLSARAQNKKTVVITTDKSPYWVSDLAINFYKPKNLSVLQLQTPAAIDSMVHIDTVDELLFFNPEIKLKGMPSDIRAEKVYCLFPDWLLQFNINNWEDRSNIWAIYRLRQ